ncbi:MAG TPA: GAF domain-containing protein [Trebonia sp.]|jgi:transcriptional regulator of acetoin/glycerol metabolism|nr:GAF domain-containing protein [Trebonia sp.]
MRLHTAGDLLATARDRFLAAEPVDARAVREPILASWRRSRQSNVAADRLDPSFLRNPDLEGALARAAGPVLDLLHDQLQGQPISIILTDSTGMILRRLTGDRDLERHLDHIHLAPGFSYAEDKVGTNGIGTALESGGPAHVFGHEHYAERLEGMACAGVPVKDPVSGKTLGVLDLTCWRRDADSLMVSLAQATAEQIGQALAAVSSSRDVRLLREYNRACRHTGGIVLALGNDIVMLNDHARRALGPGDQAALITQAGEALGRRQPGAVTVDLPSGTVARMFCHRVAQASGEDGVRDGVVHVKLVTGTLDVNVAEGFLDPDASAMTGVGLRPAGALVAGPAGAPGTLSEVPRPRPPMSLPGLIGSGAAWRRACRRAEARYDSGEWLTLEGERGVGKLALARAVHQRRNPAAPFHVLDGAFEESFSQARHEVLTGSGMLVIRHVDALSARQVRALAAILQEARTAGQHERLRVAVTLERERADADLTALLRQFPGTVEVPPLRHHIEDVRELVPFFLAKLSQQGRLTCSPPAMQLLLRHNWPGNAEQLWQVLRQVVQLRRAGQIMPRDLPPECWAVSRRVLSPLESIERDAIVQALLDHDGNKVGAARALGMSRATIYRRIHEYGIVTD